MSEKQTEQAILEYLRINGYYAQKVQSGSVLKSYKDKTYRVNLADEGTPDILACIKGIFVGIEVKKSKEEIDKWNKQYEMFKQTGELKKSWKRSIDQHEEHNKIMNAGGFVMTVSSIDELQSDIEELTSIINF